MDCENINNIQLEEVEELLTEIIVAENIIDPVIKITQGTQKGDNYASFMSNVAVEGKNKALHVIFKCAPRDEKTRKMIQTEMCFGQEIYFYNKVVPVFEIFQRQILAEGSFAAFPKCYKIVDAPGKEVIILENLKENGYVMADRKVKLNDDHVSLVLNEYGKFHAVSIALRDQKPDLFRNLVDGFLDIFSLRTTSMDFYNVLLGAAEKLKALYVEETNLDFRKAVDNIEGGMLPYFRKLDDFQKEDGVIVHGDCWSNNMMFKYGDEINPHVPTKVCFLDFQISKSIPPVVDLSYFLYSSAPNEVLDHLEQYLRVYYKSLCDHTRALGSDAEKLYPFSKLLSDWKEYAKFGFYMSLLVTRIMLSDDDDIQDFGDATAEDKKPADIFIHKENKNEGIINERLKHLVKHMYDNKFL